MARKLLLVAFLIAAAAKCATPAPPAFADELRPKGAPEKAINLGKCKPPQRAELANGEVIYVVECSSGAVILLPARLVEPGVPI